MIGDFQATCPATTQRANTLAGLTPIEVARSLQHLDGLVFFDSAGNLPPASRNPLSVIAARPRAIHRGNIHQPSDLARLESAMQNQPSTPSVDLGIPAGGLCGWVEYEGDFVFGDYPEMLVFRHVDGTWWETGSLSSCMISPGKQPTPEITTPTPRCDKSWFIRGVNRIREYIAAGDIYQANLTQSFEATVTGGTLMPLYEALRDISPAPMAAWLALDGYEILSSSPETFLRLSGRAAETRPIKGTRPRHADPDEDTRSAYELRTNPKEIAELIMITDLLRNDLGRISEFGSIEVAELLSLESLGQVHHLVSSVHGHLCHGMSHPHAVASCFPGGSITGAPKKRAMEIISEIEKYPRGLYCGAIGWFGYHGESIFNIAIRTIIRHGSHLRFQVGAGIVADSDPNHEFEETLHKATGILLAIQSFHPDSPHA